MPHRSRAGPSEQFCSYCGHPAASGRSARIVAAGESAHSFCGNDVLARIGEILRDAVRGCDSVGPLRAERQWNLRIAPPNKTCFERELLDHHRLAFEKRQLLGEGAI